MRNFTYWLFVLFFLASCASSTKLMQKARYDEAISKAVKQLRKNPNSQKDADALDRSYRIVNERNLERITYLKREGNPDSWDEVFSLYSRLKNRQSLVKTILPLEVSGRYIDYDYVDYDAQIIEAKGRAAEYFYKNGKELMKLDTKEGYRQAYDELMKAQEYTGGQYPDVNKLIEEARFKGTSRVIVLVNNKTHINLYPVFEEDLLEINTDRLENQWVEYHFKHLDENIDYDYTVFVNLERILVSPDDVKENDRMIKKEVEDGFEYVLDKNGNVMKDTAGNDIKVPKYKTLSCTVVETRQFKSVRIDGNVEIISNNPRKLIKKEPIGAENIFEHHSARAIGDIDALDKETRNLIKYEYIEFPSDFEMILNTTETLKPAIRDAMYRNRRYIY